MLILLPPSEGKSSPDAGPRLDLRALSFPSLTAPRRAVLTELTTVCRGDVDAAATALGLGPTQRDVVRANARLRTRSCAAAITVYSGVLYDALDAPSLAARARSRLDEHVVIASALWGLIRPADLIPAYRLSGSARLPGLASLPALWKKPVGTVLSEVDDFVLDLRSGAYVALGPLPRSTAARAATVRVLTEKNGRRIVVSHFNKATKGRIVRSLVQSRRTPADVDDLAHELTRSGFHVEPGSVVAGKARVIDVIVADPTGGTGSAGYG